MTKKEATSNEKEEAKINALIPTTEKRKLDTFLFAQKKTFVMWVREKISELPEYEIKAYPKRKAG